ncbi:unnamed protein product [Timema podura]|uniref:MCM10 OB-fold domain-containing protein n=1 Tax=Timema podura TaxID=61482 RepID=A0ABN7NN79_TIMPD|nr:unnamed protein product [Timema podura]
MDINDDCDIELLEEFLQEENAENISTEYDNTKHIIKCKNNLNDSTIRGLKNSRTGGKSTCIKSEVDIFSNSNNNPLNPSHNDSSQRTSAAKKILDEICGNTTNSIIHGGDTDSSDDEDNKYHEEQKYSNYGRNIKQLISKTNDWKATATGRDSYLPACRKSTDRAKDAISVVAKKPDKGTFDAYADPLFGIRLVKPLISSLSLKDMAIGRTVVPMANIKRHLANGDLSADWVFGGVIVNKSDVKKSHKGAQYAIWKISDLKGGLKNCVSFPFPKVFQGTLEDNCRHCCGDPKPQTLR